MISAVCCILVSLLALGASFLGSWVGIILGILSASLGVNSFIAKKKVRIICSATGIGISAVAIIINLLTFIGIIGPFII